MTVTAPIITTSILDDLVNKGDAIKNVPTSFAISKIDCMDFASGIVLKR